MGLRIGSSSMMTSTVGVVATMISQVYFGPFAAFAVPAHSSIMIAELPMVLALGLLAGVTAAVFVRAVDLARSAANRVPGPQWLRPALAGTVVGCVAVHLPGILGVGYGVTESALAEALPFALLVALFIAKLATTALCLGFGFGGGVFSPSLVIGAMLGGAFGAISIEVLPGAGSGIDAYVIVGMGAVSAAVLGAPISTTLVIFEMTGDYNLTVAVVLANVVAMAVTRSLGTPSFFIRQLEHRGLDLVRGLEATLLRTISVREIVSHRCEVVDAGLGIETLRGILRTSTTGELFVVNDTGALVGALSYADISEAAFEPDLVGLVVAGDIARRDSPALLPDDDLETTIQIIAASGRPMVPVVEDVETRAFAGCVYERDAIGAYNDALIRARREERH